MTLRKLLDHLKRVASHHEVNKMTCQNLAVCFGPVLLSQRQDASGLANRVFMDSEELASALHFKKHIEVLHYLLQLWPGKKKHRWHGKVQSKEMFIFVLFLTYTERWNITNRVSSLRSIVPSEAPLIHPRFLRFLNIVLPYGRSNSHANRLHQHVGERERERHRGKCKLNRSPGGLRPREESRPLRAAFILKRCGEKQLRAFGIAANLWLILWRKGEMTTAVGVAMRSGWEG